MECDWVRIRRKEKTQKNDAGRHSVLGSRGARHKNEGEWTKTILKRWWVGVVAKPGAVRLRLRRARQRHGGGDFDGEDLGRAGEVGDEHGGALLREERRCGRCGRVEGPGGSLGGSKAEGVV